MQLDAQKVLQENNIDLAGKLNKLVNKAVDRADALLDECDDIQDTFTAIKVAEIAGKMTGIVQEKQQINMQINQISGFTFIELNKDAVIQNIDSDETIEVIEN